MKFIIPMNWYPDFAAAGAEKFLAEIYGRFSNDCIGSSHDYFISFSASRNRISRIIREAHGRQLKFNYIIDATCTGNFEWTRKWERKLRRFLDYLSGIKVDSLTISIPYFAELINSCYPDFEIKTSHCLRINTLLRAKRWAELGAGTIALDSAIADANPELVSKIKEATGCRVEIVCKCNFFKRNPCSSYYYNKNAHLSSGFDDGTILPLEVTNEGLFNKKNVNTYEKFGIKSLKLTGDKLNKENLNRVIL